MELNEAGRRIFGQHWLLILSLTALGALAAASMHLGDRTQYTATARMVLGTEDPKTSSESAAISDTAWALATAPSSIERALAASQVKAADPDQVAERVSVSAVGASGVLELAVTDGNPRAASALANALAREVSTTRAGSIDREQAKLLGQIDRRITSLDRQVSSLETGPLGPRERTQIQSAVQQRAVLETQRTTALLDATREPQPQVISAATAPVDPDESGRWSDIALGAILGFVLGAALAAMIETLRPTLVGGEALARELGTPLLGTLSTRPLARAHGAPAIAGRLRLASKAAGVQNIGLLPVRRDADLSRLTEQLGGDDEGGRRIRPFDVSSSALVNGGGTGLVVVAPDAPKKAELEEIRHLLALTPGPLLGVVTYSRRNGNGNGAVNGGHVNGGHVNGDNAT